MCGNCDQEGRRPSELVLFPGIVMSRLRQAYKCESEWTSHPESSVMSGLDIFSAGNSFRGQSTFSSLANLALPTDMLVYF